MRRLLYTLRDPTTGAVRYVGCSKNPAERLAHHLSTYCVGLYRPLGIWILRLMRKGLRPTLSVESVCTCGGRKPKSPFDPCELSLIRLLLSEGALLYNNILPDDGGRRVYIANPMIDYLSCRDGSQYDCNCRKCRRYRRLWSFWNDNRLGEPVLSESHSFDPQSLV